jgi:hypothetical protein
LLRCVRAAVVASAVLAAPSIAAAQSAVDSAVDFYLKGGAYCFRIAPFGVGLSEETEWTVMMLTSKENRQNTFRIRSVDAGETGVTKSGLQTLGRLANEVWKFDGSRSEFFERFSHGIRDGRLRARVVKLVPPRLARASTERERADVYLDFADRGSKVSFDKAPDLTPDEFQTYAEHFID